MASIPLKVQKREITGRKVKQLRRTGIIPGNVFGKAIESTSISVVSSDFDKVYKEAGETGLVDLQLDDKKHPVLISNVHIDPVTSAVLHVDFHEVNLKEKVTATVPVEITGESPIEKNGEGTVVQQLQEIEVEALPTDLPESFIVDVSILTEVDQAIYIKDLVFDRTKIEVQAEEDAIVAKVEPPQKEEEIALPEAEGEGAESGATDAGSTEEGTAETDEAENQSKQEEN
jgi:large subunit ribosomal protein L25